MILNVVLTKPFPRAAAVTVAVVVSPVKETLTPAKDGEGIWN